MIYPWGKLTNFSTSIDLKINAVACQLLRLFAAENDGDAILDIQSMTFSRGSMPPNPPSLAPLSLCDGELLAQPIGQFEHSFLILIDY